MPDREKVIKDFESEIMNFTPACTSDELLKEIMETALELLKEQEPRVLTLEDVKQAEAGTVVWLEWRIESKINSVIFFRLINKGIDDSLEFHELDGFVAARLACYRTEWRCWSALPTVKQRQAVKWDK